MNMHIFRLSVYIVTCLLSAYMIDLNVQLVKYTASHIRGQKGDRRGPRRIFSILLQTVELISVSVMKAMRANFQRDA